MIPTGVSMVVSGGAVSPENRSNEREAIRQRSQRLHATGTGNALDVAEDVRWLLDSLAAVERERDQLKAGFRCGTPCSCLTHCPQYAGQVECDPPCCFAAAVRQRGAALARIAAVEAALLMGGQNGEIRCNAALVALAASPTPTAAEKYAPCRDCGHDSADHRNDEPRPCKKRCRCVSFESPLPGQEKP